MLNQLMIITPQPKPMLIPYLKKNRNRRDLFLILRDQDNESENIRLTKVDSNTFSRNPIRDSEFSCQKYGDD